MDERRLKSGAVAVLSLVVVGIAAATLGETTRSDAPGTGGGGSGGGVTSGGSTAASDLLVPRDPLPLIAILVVVTAVLLVVGVVLFPRHTLRQTAWAGVVTAFLLGLLWLLYLGLGDVRPPMPSERSANVSAPGAAGTAVGPGGGGGASSIPEPLLFGVLVAALLGLGVVGLLVRDASAPEGVETEVTDAATLSAIGRSAGRAADRLAEDDDVSPDNEVYRAWKEMTDHLDVDNPGARTPGEFRAAALEAGMAAEDVDALTDLFEAVRYGGTPATDEREATARDALRRIEERYAGKEGSP